MIQMIQKIALIQERIDSALLKSQRPKGSVTLVAISKKQTSITIREAYEAGIDHFGENYVQEALKKMADLEDLAITWHFTGPIQSNKTKDIARHFSWVHGLDREKIAILLSQHRPKDLEPLNICLQINLDNEESKSGIPINEALLLAESVQRLPNLKLRGFMVIPKPRHTKDEQYHSFLRVSQLFDRNRQYLPISMDTLSMGMSDDFEAAILAGSTMIRIGRALFGGVS